MAGTGIFHFDHSKKSPRIAAGGRRKSDCNYLPAAALVPAIRPVVKHIWMEVPEAGYSL